MNKNKFNPFAYTPNNKPPPNNTTQPTQPIQSTQTIQTTHNNNNPYWRVQKYKNKFYKFINLNKCQYKQSKDRMLAMVQNVKQINHKHVIKIILDQIKGDQLFLQMELCYIDLLTFMKLKHQSNLLLKQETVLRFFIQFLEGFIEIRKYTTQINDIELSNVYLSHCGQIKIGHFPFAQILNKNEYIRLKWNKRQKLRYHSPFLYDIHQRNIMDVIWSWGIFMYEALSGRPPYNPNISQEQLKKRIKLNLMDNINNVSPQTMKLIKTILSIQITQMNIINILQQVIKIYLNLNNNLNQQRNQLQKYINIRQAGHMKDRMRDCSLPKMYKLSYLIESGNNFKKYDCDPFYLLQFQLKREQEERRQNLWVQFFKQLQIIMKLANQNILKIFQMFLQQPKLYISMEKVQKSIVQYRMSQQPNHRLKQQEALKIFQQILNGYSTLIDKYSLFEKLNSQNILITDIFIDKQGKIKLSDFRFPKEIFNFKNKKLDQLICPSHYMSPQVLNNMPFTQKAQIWSLGVILYQLIFGIKPWNGQYLNLINRKKSDQTSLTFPKIQVTNSTKELLKSMLEINQKQRISWKKLFTRYMIDTNLDTQQQDNQFDQQKQNKINKRQNKKPSSKHIKSQQSIDQNKYLIQQKNRKNIKPKSKDKNQKNRDYQKRNYNYQKEEKMVSQQQKSSQASEQNQNKTKIKNKYEQNNPKKQIRKQRNQKFVEDKKFDNKSKSNSKPKLKKEHKNNENNKNKKHKQQDKQNLDESQTSRRMIDNISSEEKNTKKNKSKPKQTYPKKQKQKQDKPKIFKVTLDKKQISKIILLKVKNQYSKYKYSSLKSQLQNSSYCLTLMQEDGKIQLQRVIKKFGQSFQNAAKKLLYR